MTVRRNLDEIFHAAPEVVADGVRRVLSRRPPYIRTIEKEKGMVFDTSVKPNWWLLGTEMIIRLHSFSGGTQVKVDTRSQWFILGDIFQYYNGYIRNFFGALRADIEKQETHR